MKEPFFVLATNEDEALLLNEASKNLTNAYKLIAEKLFTEIRFILISKILLNKITNFNLSLSIHHQSYIFVVKDNNFELFNEANEGLAFLFFFILFYEFFLF